jgi:uncharacterized protein
MFDGDSLFKAAVVQQLLEMRGKGTGPEFAGGTDVCVCPECGTETPHVRGVPCNETQCPECNAAMTGKGALGEAS